MATTPILPDYPDGPIPGYPGDLADIGLKDSISRQNTGTIVIAFGAAVQDGPANAVVVNSDLGCQKYAGGRVIGFAKSDFALRPVPGMIPGSTATPLQYQPGDMVHVLRDARMRAFANADVLAGAPVTVDVDGNVVVGAGTAVPGCTWESFTKANHVGIIQILIQPAVGP